MLLQRADERLDGPPVGLEVRDGSPVRPVAARERDVHDQPAAVALGDQPPEPAEERLARPALGVHRRDVLVERAQVAQTRTQLKPWRSRSSRSRRTNSSGAPRAP